jgi:hypothetical protein
MASIKKTNGASSREAKGIVNKLKNGIKSLKRIAAEVRSEREAREKANARKPLKKASAKKATAKKAPAKATLKSKMAKPRKTAGKAKTKATTKQAPNYIEPKLPKGQILTHGPDQHLIPVTGELHPAGKQDGTQHEKIFHTREEVALHQENQRAKAALASRKSVKRVFRNFRQS